VLDDRRPRVIATIGSFDGVHLGHQELLRQVVSRARALGCESMAVTFDPIPDLVLYPDRYVTELTDREQKQQLIQNLGVEHVRVFEFTRELSMLRPEEFIGQLQAGHSLCELWVGSDFAFGRDRSGTISALVEIGSGEGFALHVVPPVKIGHSIVSSTHIRTLLSQGDVTRATELLGHRHVLAGVVTRGAGRGQMIGFPTANLRIPPTRTMPADGVYAALVPLDSQYRPAVVNLGGRPTFGEVERLIEVHLLDYDGELHDQRLVVEFVARLRDVRKFGSIEELRAQITNDIAAAQKLPELRTTAGTENTRRDEARRW
jgi:riboflavin kinase/FMN adenylyltransferase